MLAAMFQANRVVNEVVRMHGSYGFTRDDPAEKFCRNVKLRTIGEGTREIQCLAVARQLPP
jgi:alkylation response protein AidB-like acyl-CoA dehydrogenase